MVLNSKNQIKMVNGILLSSAMASTVWEQARSVQTKAVGLRHTVLLADSSQLYLPVTLTELLFGAVSHWNESRRGVK